MTLAHLHLTPDILLQGKTVQHEKCLTYNSLFIDFSFFGDNRYYIAGFSSKINKDILTNRPWAARIQDQTSQIVTLTTGVPQGHVFSPLLFSLLTLSLFARYPGNHIINFRDDIAVLGLINNYDEIACREEMRDLEKCWGVNNHLLTSTKQKR